MKRRPFSAGEVPPGSCFRHRTSDTSWAMPSEVNDWGVTFWSYAGDGKGEHLFRTWEQMMDYQIKPPGFGWMECSWPDPDPDPVKESFAAEERLLSS